MANARLAERAVDGIAESTALAAAGDDRTFGNHCCFLTRLAVLEGMVIL
jgi:hypothetical protein